MTSSPTEIGPAGPIAPGPVAVTTPAASQPGGISAEHPAVGLPVDRVHACGPDLNAGLAGPGRRNRLVGNRQNFRADVGGSEHDRWHASANARAGAAHSPAAGRPAESRPAAGARARAAHTPRQQAAVSAGKTRR